jgi:hypothetical protein
MIQSLDVRPTLLLGDLMHRRFHSPTLWFVLIFLLSACAHNPAQKQPVFIAPAEGSPAVQPSRQPTTIEIPALTPEPLTFWISPEVPVGIWDQADPPDGMSWAGGVVDDAVTLGISERMPPDRVVLAQSEWVFALVAPFKTTQDNVNTVDLQAAFQGSPQGGSGHLKHLAVYEGDYHSLVALLGGASGGDVISETITFLPDDVDNISAELTAETWAIVPFDRLQPEYKVISVDSISPLDDDFALHAYALKGVYSLYAVEATATRIPEETRFALMVTNRDPDKLTTLVMTGVTALVRATAYTMEVKGITYPARDIVDWLSTADITHISNEVSFYEGCPDPDPSYGSLSFCSHPKYMALLDFLGADVIELTGNHNNDAYRMFDVDVVPSTLALYEEHNMLYFGGGLNLEDSMQPAIIEHNGNKLAFIGCNAAGPDFAWATETSGGSAPCEDFVWMEKEISRLKQEGYLPIATFQYYEDYNNYASPQMKEDFRRMAEAGAVIVNGSQAHRPKELEFINGALIHYGLGNLFFDQMTIEVNGVTYTQTRNEFIQRHVFYNGKYISTELLTAVLEDYAKPRPMTFEERQIFLDEIFSVRE